VICLLLLLSCAQGGRAAEERLLELQLLWPASPDNSKCSESRNTGPSTTGRRGSGSGVEGACRASSVSPPLPTILSNTQPVKSNTNDTTAFYSASKQHKLPSLFAFSRAARWFPRLPGLLPSGLRGSFISPAGHCRRRRQPLTPGPLAPCLAPPAPSSASHTPAQPTNSPCGAQRAPCRRSSRQASSSFLHYGRAALLLLHRLVQHARQGSSSRHVP
jgi:hypothetical protein